jgi:hypothetical protein
MENEKHKRKRGKKMYEVFCAECSRELTSKEIDYWKNAKKPQSQMICYYCLHRRTMALKVELPYDYLYFGRETPVPAEDAVSNIQPSGQNSNTENIPKLDLSKANFLKEDFNYDPAEPVTVHRAKEVQSGPFSTKAIHESIENSNLKLTKITAIGSNENVSLTLILPETVPPELIPLLQNGVNKFLAVAINFIAFAPLHGSVLKPFFKDNIDENFDPNNIRYPWGDN